jgi:hypothetical protein
MHGKCPEAGREGRELMTICFAALDADGALLGLETCCACFFQGCLTLWRVGGKTWCLSLLWF